MTGHDGPVAAVLVTGGTGTLGRALVPLLLADGHDVRVLSRRAEPALPPGARAVLGDVRTGAGIAAAVTGAEVVIHAATSPRREIRVTEVEGARHVAAAASTAEAHLIYVSIVGVDRHRFPYYKAKRAAERVVEGSGTPWTVLRATQFHDLIDQILAARWFLRTPHMRFQPVATTDVARRLGELVAGAPQGLAPDLGGPEILDIRDLAATRRAARGRAARLVPVPPVGFLADYDAGLHLAPRHRDGTVTWREWLERR
jgi:uncharacterized protein YbjT (DUF2867 family)